MSDKGRKRINSENLVTSFIRSGGGEGEGESEEPTNKKKKLVDQIDDDENDNSLAFFKTVRTFSRKRNAAAASSTSSKATRAKKAKQSQPDIRQVLGRKDNDNEEDLYEKQLALAISESLKDHQQSMSASSVSCEPSTSAAATLSSNTKSNDKSKKKKLKENPFAQDGKVQSISSVLEKYGFQARKPYTEYEMEMIANSNPKKRSKYRKVPTKLTRTTQEEREAMASARIDDILSSWKTQKSPPQSDYRFPVECYYLQKMTEPFNTVFSKHGVEAHSETMLYDFYVTEFFKPSFVRPGHLLKDWGKIFGRAPSPEIAKETHARTEEEKIHISEDNNQSCSDIFDGIESFKLDTSANMSKKSSPEREQSVFQDLTEINDKLSQTSEVVEVEQEEEILQNRDKNEAEGHNESSHVQSCDDSKMIEAFSIKSSGSESTLSYSYDDQQRVNPQEERVAEVKVVDDHIDLTQHVFEEEKEEEAPDCVDLTQQVGGESATVDLTEEMNTSDIDYSQKLSQTCTSDEVISVSDDEINYSVQAQNLSGTESSEDVLEIDNMVEQSLMHFMAEDELNEVGADNALNMSVASINETINLCMEGAKTTDASLKKEPFSPGIMEILNKYNAEREIFKENTPRTDVCELNFDDDYDVHMPSTSYKFATDVDALPTNDVSQDSSIVAILKKYGKREKENQATKEEEEKELEELDTEPMDVECDGDQNEKSQEMRSMRKSLNNILNTPVSTKSAKKPARQTLRKKSLGLNLNEKYIIDTEQDYPEPHYSSMNPVELKRELYKFGIKTLPVKNAISLLTHIYEQTHPQIKVKATEEIDQNDSRINMNATDLVTNIGMQGETDEYVFQTDSDGILCGEEYILPKMKKSKAHSCALPLHISFYNMVRSSEKLQRFILEFRPLDLDEVYRHFRKFNLSYQLNDIIAFLDRRCIAFKTKEQASNKRHQKRKGKTAATQKT